LPAVLRPVRGRELVEDDVAAEADVGGDPGG
jgi:hypothetical protein